MFAGISIIARVFANLGELFRPFCCTRNGTRYWGNFGFSYFFSLEFSCWDVSSSMLETVEQVYIHPIALCWSVQTTETLQHHQIRWSEPRFSFSWFYFIFFFLLPWWYFCSAGMVSKDNPEIGQPFAGSLSDLQWRKLSNREYLPGQYLFVLLDWLIISFANLLELHSSNC
jgi:hypothetical protein